MDSEEGIDTTGEEGTGSQDDPRGTGDEESPGGASFDTDEAPPEEQEVVVLEETEPAATTRPPETHAASIHSASEDDDLAPAPRAVASAGIAPSVPQFDDAPGAEASAIQVDGDWRFEYHGFLRAPLRMGIGPKNDQTDGVEAHVPPRVPDLSFTDWRYTHNIPGPWTQLLLSYGNGRVTGTVGIAAFNHTNAGYRELQANLGINETFLTLNFPETFGRYGGLVWNVGSFSNRYGTSGRYNAGRYNTYLFGRTRLVGETLTAGLHLTPDLTLTLEHGFGAKLDVIPYETVTPRPEYLPYPGPEPQGTTWATHGHVILAWNDTLTFGAHGIYSRSPDDRQLLGAPSTPGEMSIMGGEVRLTGGAFGHGYLGYSRVDASNVLSLSDSVEVLHSFHGWNFKNNFFGRYDPRTGTSAPDDSGTVDTILFQYDLSIGALARYPTRFRGNAPDLNVSLFAMFNHVNSETFTQDKFKWGADVIYQPFPVAGIGLRYDLVQPDLGAAEESFAVLSPKLIFQTDYLTKEQVTVQYSRYFLGSRAYAAFPYADVDEADQNVVTIAGRMWW